MSADEGWNESMSDNSTAWLGGGSGSEEKDEGQQVVFSSKEEQVICILFIAFCATFTIIGQLLVLVTIIKSPSLHCVHFYIIAGYCCGDLLSVGIAAPNYIVTFTVGRTMNATYCRTASTIVICVILGMTYHTGLIAYER